MIQNIKKILIFLFILQTSDLKKEKKDKQNETENAMNIYKKILILFFYIVDSGPKKKKKDKQNEYI